MSILNFIIKIAAPAPKLESFQNYLFVGPHPDDIEIGAGATAAKLAAMGKNVSFVICTDGRFGTEHIQLPADELAELRRKEAISSAAGLGVNNVRFLNFSDGGLYSVDELKVTLAAVIGEMKPDIILCPDPDSEKECHSDHLNVGRVCKELAFFAPFENIMSALGASSAPVSAVAFYFSARPNRYVNTSGFLNKQLASIFSCHLSQFPHGCDAGKQITTYLRLRACCFGIKSLCASAEGFRVLDRTNMHCLPD